MSYHDDGHIVVCVRVRDVPAASVPLNNNSAATPTRNASSTFAPPSGRRGSVLQSPTPLKASAATSDQSGPPPCDANAICVSCLENIVTMHDPRSLNDPASVARDSSALLEVLRNREEGGPPPTGRGMPIRGGGATATYFETDEVVISLSPENARQMPVVRSSDFVAPPPLGSQEDVYACTAAHAVTATLSGVNSCLFAYGQTNSGKTYTLFGTTSDPGVVPRALEDLFTQLHDRKRSESRFTFTVQLSFFEIYQEEIFCLLSKTGPLKLTTAKEGAAPVIQNLDQRTIDSAAAGGILVEMGLRRRQVGETGMNARSSRSHAIVQVQVQQISQDANTGASIELNATLNLIDLAGSERQRTAKTEGKSHMEGIQINKSLSTLARVINDVASGAKYVNFRDSTLTQLLKENLGGNSRTFMVATISPIANCYQESCATLQYAKDVRRIRNRPRANKTFQSREHLRDVNAKLIARVEELQAALQLARESATLAVPTVEEVASGNSKDVSPIMETLESVKEDMQDQVSHAALCPVLLSFRRTIRDGTTVQSGGPLHVTALQDNLMSLDVASQLKSNNNNSAAAAGNNNVSLPSLGSIRFRTIAQRPCHKTYWMSCVPPPIPTTDEENNLSLLPMDDVFVEVNGRRVASMLPRENQEEEEVLKEGEDVAQRDPQGFAETYAAAMMSSTPIPLTHGDVIVIGRDLGHTQELLVLHFVDLSATHEVVPPVFSSASTRSVSSSYNALSISRSASTQAAPILSHQDQLLQQQQQQQYQLETTTMLHAEMEELRRNLAKAHDENAALARTLEYHVQMQNESQRRQQRWSASRSQPSSQSQPLSEGGDASPSPTARHVPPARLSMTATSLHSPLQQAADEELQNQKEKRGTSLSTLSASTERGSSTRLAIETSRSVSRTAATMSLASNDVHNSHMRMQLASQEISQLQTQLAASQAALEALQVEKDDMENELIASRQQQPSMVFTSEHNNKTPRAQIPMAHHHHHQQQHALFSTPTAPSLARTDTEGDLTARTPLTGRTRDHDATWSASVVKDRLQAINRTKEMRQQLTNAETRIEELQSLLRSLERVSQENVENFKSDIERLTLDVDYYKDTCNGLATEGSALRHEVQKYLETIQQLDMTLTEQAQTTAEQVENLFAETKEKEKGLKRLLSQWKWTAVDWETKFHIAMQAAHDLATQQAPQPAVPIATLPIKGCVSLLLPTATNGSQVRTASASVGTTAMDDTRLAVLESNVKELESERATLHAQLEETSLQLEHSRGNVEQLALEVERLQQQQLPTPMTPSLAQSVSAASQAEAQKQQQKQKALKEKLTQKSEELRAAQELCEKLTQKLDVTMQMKNRLQGRTTVASGMLKSEQGRHLKNLQEEVAGLTAALAEKEEEVLLFSRLNASVVAASLSTLPSSVDAEDRLATLRNEIEKLLRNHCDGNERNPPGTLLGSEVVPPHVLAQSSHTAFSKQFVFTHPMIITSRAAMRVLFDRLKSELYILNKSTLHIVSSLLGAVQLRPDTMFHGAMTEIRRVVSTVTKSAQRIGVRWTLTSDDAALYFGSSSSSSNAPLVDSDRRALQKAFLTCLLWYDHWDSSAKSDHASYIELLRNFECVFAMARAVRRDGCAGTTAMSILQISTTTSQQTHMTKKELEEKEQTEERVTQLEAESRKAPAELAREALAKLRNSQKSSVLSQFVTAAPISSLTMTNELDGNSNKIRRNESSTNHLVRTASSTAPLSVTVNETKQVSRSPQSTSMPATRLPSPDQQEDLFSLPPAAAAAATRGTGVHPLSKGDVDFALVFGKTGSTSTSLTAGGGGSHPSTMRTSKSNPVSPRFPTSYNNSKVQQQPVVPNAEGNNDSTFHSSPQKGVSAPVATRVNRMTEDELVAYCMKETRHLVASSKSSRSHSSVTAATSSRSRSGTTTHAPLRSTSSTSSAALSKMQKQQTAVPPTAAEELTTQRQFFRSTTPPPMGFGSSPVNAPNNNQCNESIIKKKAPSTVVGALASSATTSSSGSAVFQRQDSWSFLTKTNKSLGGGPQQHQQRMPIGTSTAVSGPFANTLLALQKSAPPGSVMVAGRDGGMVPVPRLSLKPATGQK